MSDPIQQENFLPGDDPADEKSSIILSPMGTSTALEPDDEELSLKESRKPRYFVPLCGLYDSLRVLFRGSIQLAFLSHACFITASLFYIGLGFTHLFWYNDTHNKIPEDLIQNNDDQLWADWASESENEYIIDERENYRQKTKLIYTIGAYFFCVVGVLDYMRFCDVLNFFMILAGATGMISGISHSHSDIWDCVSVHLYFLEAINLLHRSHDYEGYPCFRLSDICFLFGSLLDIGNCYLKTIGGFSGIRLIYSDLTASFLWFGCAIIDLSAEIYYLKKHRRSGQGLVCY